MYQLHVENGPAYEGTELAITLMAEETGLDPRDIEYAKDEMRKLGHDYANFGVYGRFLFTGSDSKAA